MAKTTRKKNYTVFHILMTVAFFAFLVCSATWLVVAVKPWYALVIEKLGIPGSTGYPLAVCRENYGVLIDYNMFFGPSVLSFPDFSMSRTGALHFREVKQIFVGMQYTAMGTLVLLIPGFLYAKKKKTWRFLRWTALASFIVTLVLGGAFLIGQEDTFVFFHYVLFRNDYWIFNEGTDPIIRILPEEVFITGALLILALVLLGAAIGYIVYRVKTKRKRK